MKTLLAGRLGATPRPTGSYSRRPALLIARRVGHILVVASLTALINPNALHEIGQEFLASRALIFIAGFLALLGGLAILNTRSLWTTGWLVIIAIFGWVAIIGGILRIAFPALTKSIGETMLAREAVLRAAAGIQMVLGTYLMIMGYL